MFTIQECTSSLETAKRSFCHAVKTGRWDKTWLYEETIDQWECWLYQAKVRAAKYEMERRASC